MKTKTKTQKTIEYGIFVEGGLAETTTSRLRANNLRKKYQSEGWNVRIVKYVDTLIGVLGINI